MPTSTPSDREGYKAAAAGAADKKSVTAYMAATARRTAALREKEFREDLANYQADTVSVSSLQAAYCRKMDADEANEAAQALEEASKKESAK